LDNGRISETILEYEIGDGAQTTRVNNSSDDTSERGTNVTYQVQHVRDNVVCCMDGTVDVTSRTNAVLPHSARLNHVVQ